MPTTTMSPTPTLTWMVVAIIGALIAGSCVRWMALRQTDSQTRAKRLASLRTWWILSIVLSAAVILGNLGVCVLMTAASLLGMREYVRLVATRHEDRWGARLIYLAIPLQYLWILFDWQEAVYVFIPLFVLLLVSAVQVLQGHTEGYVRRTAGMAWGAMLLVYGLSHAALLTNLPAAANPKAGSVGWFLYLVLLTETNDIFQALIGRRFGKDKRHQITPSVSPNKTWEGFVGGMLVTMLLAAALSPLLAPIHDVPLQLKGSLQWHIPFVWPVVTGIIIAISGFVGDINMSAVKRDVGVKDSSGLLPGMGGMIDRIDSLTFAAPVFYYLLKWLI